VWGGLNALYFLPYMLTKSNRKHMSVSSETSLFPGIKEILLIAMTFGLTVIAWIFFRAENLTHAFAYIGGILDFQFAPFNIYKCKYLPLVALLVVWEWSMRSKMHGLEFSSLKRPLRWALYLVLTWLILFFYGEEQAFIYFQF